MAHLGHVYDFLFYFLLHLSENSATRILNKTEVINLMYDLRSFFFFTFLYSRYEYAQNLGETFTYTKF